MNGAERWKLAGWRIRSGRCFPFSKWKEMFRGAVAAYKVGRTYPSGE